jgi:predicted extracellular nuclease
VIRLSRGKRVSLPVRRQLIVALSLVLLLALALVTKFSPIVPSAEAVSTTVVISQFQVAGGSAADEFVEIHNVSNAEFDLNGHRLVYRAAAGTTDVSLVQWTASTKIPAGGFYLVAHATGYDGSVASNITWSGGATGTFQGTSGGIGLRNGALDSGTIVDSVGYGTATNVFRETASVNPGPAANDSKARKTNGCQDTDNNNDDFETITPSAPRNSSTVIICGGGGGGQPTLTINNVTLNEGNAGATTFTFTVSLSSAAGVGGVTYNIATQDNTATVADNDYNAINLTGETIAQGQTSKSYNITVNGDTTNEPNETFNVNVTSVTGATVGDGQGQGTINNDDGSAGSLRIHDIQGASHLSPQASVAVTNVPGIVTAKRTAAADGSKGFYIQDPLPDSNDATSEGIFVFTTNTTILASVNIGDSVLVSGTVSEFRPGGASSANLTVTEISGPTVIVSSTGNPLPAPIVVGTGGRIPPMEVIEDDSAADIETSNVFDPASDGIDFYESLEHMRVQVNNAVVVGPTTDFGASIPGREVYVIGDNGANASVRTGRGGIVIRANDFNPERIVVTNLFQTLGDLNVADTFTAPIVGIYDYNFGKFLLHATSALTTASGGLTREVAATPGAGELTIATFNVENLDPNDGAVKFNELAGLIVNNLRSPDLITVEEIQDNNGATNDSVVDANVTFNTLIAAITSAGGPTYQFRQINPVDDQDGGEPGGNIRVGFLFRTDRGLSFVDRPGGTPTSSTTVNNNGGMPELSYSPGRIDPNNAAFNASRKPLAGEFLYNGRKLFVIGNHFNSKGGDDPTFGRRQPPVLSSEAQRLQQAQIVNDFVDSILAVDANANIVVLGDINDFQFSAPMTVLKGGVLHALIDTLPVNERYSYDFQGNSQSLDHILVSNNLFNTIFKLDVVHVNSEFAVQASDHDPQVAYFTFIRKSNKFDFDGDGKTDFSIFRPGDNAWYILNSMTNTVTVKSWGIAQTDQLVPGDYDGDRKTDIAVWRPAEGNWYIIQSMTGTGRVESLGLPGDVPVPADYDGDGTTDVAVWRGSTGEWLIKQSSQNGTLRPPVSWGQASLNDLPVPGDYDGDGRTDIAVWRPSEGNWYIIKSQTNTGSVQGWGQNGDKLVQADYNGDGLTDVAVFRPSEGNWYIRNSGTNTVTLRNWGFATDRLVPGDYDGDGSTDLAVFRESEGNWYVIKSGSSNILQPWGMLNDRPLPAAYIPQ